MATRAATSNLRLQHRADEALLAKLGYKQELRREFTPLEVSLIPGSFEYTTQSNSSIDVWACIQLYRIGSLSIVSRH